MAITSRSKYRVGALAGTTMVAACGGGSHPAGSGASSPPGLAQALDAYTHCMRGYGFPGLYATRAPSNSLTSAGYLSGRSR